VTVGKLEVVVTGTSVVKVEVKLEPVTVTVTGVSDAEDAVPVIDPVVFVEEMQVDGETATRETATQPVGRSVKTATTSPDGMLQNDAKPLP